MLDWNVTNILKIKKHRYPCLFYLMTSFLSWSKNGKCHKFIIIVKLISRVYVKFIVYKYTYYDGIQAHNICIQWNLYVTATEGTLQKWPLWAGGRYTEVDLHYNSTLGTWIRWPLCSGNRYTKVAVKQIPLYIVQRKRWILIHNIFMISINKRFDLLIVKIRSFLEPWNKSTNEEMEWINQAMGKSYHLTSM